MSLGRTKGGNPKVSIFFLFVAHVSYACCINQRRGTSPSLECHMKHLNHRVSGRMNRHIKTLLLLLYMYISMEIGNDFDIVSYQLRPPRDHASCSAGNYKYVFIFTRLPKFVLLYCSFGKATQNTHQRLNKQRVFWALRSPPTPCALRRTLHSFLFGNVYCIL